jgi:hypothetical protein
MTGLTTYGENYIKMLSRYFNRSFRTLLRRSAAPFSGGHDHHHHDYSVHVDQDALLIRYKSVRFD